VIVPARPYKPRDKAKVEVAVLVAMRFIVAKLRKRRFFSLADLRVSMSRSTLGPEQSACLASTRR
jgi:hypothetical protein